MTRLAFLPLACIASALTACSQDFGLEGMLDEHQAADTGTPDEAEPEEEAEPDEETPDEETEEEPDGEALPDDEEPADEEPEEDPPAEDDCEDTSDLVYVVARDDESLRLFDPETLRFTTLGRLDCPTSGSPGSMAVARDGFAYVRYSDERIYEVDLASMRCDRTDFHGASGLDSFGMGYATEDAGTWRDHLFVADADSLARVDTGSWDVDFFGDMPSQSELTGNAAGELWAFFPLESPAQLAQVDMETGRRIDTIGLNTFPNPGDIDAFAFATWGGDFWLFVRTYGMGSSSDVYQVGIDGRMTRVMSDIGFDIVGAGVSTCAPSE